MEEGGAWSVWRVKIAWFQISNYPTDDFMTAWHLYYLLCIQIQHLSSSNSTLISGLNSDHYLFGGIFFFNFKTSNLCRKKHWILNLKNKIVIETKFHEY